MDETTRKLIYGDDNVDSISRKSKHKRKRKRTDKEEIPETVGITQNTDRKGRKRKRQEKGEKDPEDPRVKESTDEQQPQAISFATERAAESDSVLNDPAGEPEGEEESRKVALEREGKKVKKRRRIEVDEPGPLPSARPNDALPVDPKKTPVEGDSPPQNGERGLAKTLKKRKRKSTKADAYEDPAPPSTGETDEKVTTEKPSKGKRKRQADGSGGAAPDTDTADTEKTRKKRRKQDDQEVVSTELSERVVRKKKSRSSHKDSGDLPNPAGDKTLSESALKALLYVYTQVSSQSGWKFNKARQNWIIRNIWEPEDIPDVYFPSCVKYLASIQGNTRDVLIKTSISLLESCVVPPRLNVTFSADAGELDPDQGHGASEGEGNSLSQQLKGERARAVLAALGSNPQTENQPA